MVLCDRYPELSETFVVSEVRALERSGLNVTVEAIAAPVQPAEDIAPVRTWEQERTRERLIAAAWLALRHPWRCAADLAARRRWRREESVPPLRMLAPAARRIAVGDVDHVHAHFAAGAALAALRLSGILQIPYSVTAHGYDIYQQPRNLHEKIARAKFATTGCDYTVADVKRAAGPEHAGRVHRIVMGIDGTAFERSQPYPGGRSILAVGRLVEKKGFADLIAAVALMSADGDPPEQVTIAGDGPLHGELATLGEHLGVGDLVELPGAVSHERVRALLDAADVLCMPCVVASDGDRDSMPVIVKEALAMEVPVVATDEVGLPEVVREEWGVLVPPRDPQALAAALGAELARPVRERIARGRAGRAFVLAQCDVDAEGRRLAALIDRP